MRRKVDPQALRENPVSRPKAAADQQDAPARPVDLATQNVERQVDKAAVAASAGVLKPDQRLERNGWIPGPLMKRCTGRDAKFIGGMKATTCADCAYGRRAVA